MFSFAHEKIGLRWGDLCSHGGAKDFVDVCVHKGIMFKYENENSVKYMVTRAVCG